jgi:hypothetical protein
MVSSVALCVLCGETAFTAFTGLTPSPRLMVSPAPPASLRENAFEILWHKPRFSFQIFGFLCVLRVLGGQIVFGV